MTFKSMTDVYHGSAIGNHKRLVSNHEKTITLLKLRNGKSDMIFTDPMTDGLFMRLCYHSNQDFGHT